MIPWFPLVSLLTSLLALVGNMVPTATPSWQPASAHPDPVVAVAPAQPASSVPTIPAPQESQPAEPAAVELASKMKVVKPTKKEPRRRVESKKTEPKHEPVPASSPDPAPSQSSLPVTTNPDNPFIGADLYIDPNSTAAKFVAMFQSTRPGDAALLQKIASQPQGHWLSGGEGTISHWDDVFIQQVAAAGKVPILVPYHIPQRNCIAGQGAANASQYQSWIQSLANSIGSHRVIVVLEPDAIAQSHCLSEADQTQRFQSLAQAVHSLKANANTAVYLDAGNAIWRPASEMIPKLNQSGIGEANGFALNVANYATSAESIAFGTTVSAGVSNKHFIVDTAQNGLGAPANHQFNNPPGRALGSPFTTNTSNPLVDAFVWVIKPGFPGATCGNASLDACSPDYALGLASRASW